MNAKFNTTRSIFDVAFSVGVVGVDVTFDTGLAQLVGVEGAACVEIDAEIKVSRETKLVAAAVEIESVAVGVAMGLVLNKESVEEAASTDVLVEESVVMGTVELELSPAAGGA